MVLCMWYGSIYSQEVDQEELAAEPGFKSRRWKMKVVTVMLWNVMMSYLCVNVLR